jgi:hypothetical protein
MSLAPVPAEQPETTCAKCGAVLVADQRYCLECGQPCSPVRLSFLDVLAPEPARAPAALPAASTGAGALAPAGYAPVYAEHGAGGWLRRNAGLLSLLSVLLLCLIAGLLVGHWATQGKQSSAPQVVKIEGLGGLGATAGTGAAASGTPASSGASSTSSKAGAKQEAEEAKAAAKETKAEKAPPPAPVNASPQKLQKLSNSTGKKHQEEINALGAQPIETG